MYLLNPQLLEQLRRSKGLTRTELAALATKSDGGTPSRQLISNYLDGRRRTAPRVLAESLSAALGVDPSHLWAERPR